MERRPAARGGEIGFEVRGTAGPWVVLLHGWCGEASTWSAIRPALSADRRVVTLSYPGFGGMAPPPPAGRTIEAFAESVADVLRVLGVDKPILVGHSLGGAVAVECAIRLASEARGLIGIDTLTDRSFYMSRAPAEIAERRAVFEKGFADRMRAMVDDLVHPSFPAAVRSRIAEPMASVPPPFALDAMDCLLRWDLEARWPLVPCGAILLDSAHLANRPGAEPPAACLLGVPVRLYPSGHFPMIEHPPLIAELLLEALDELGGTPSPAFIRRTR